MIKSLFKKTFNIHEGEMRIALLMQLYIFLLITVLLLIKPSVSALFLSHLGSEKLPYAYLLVALVAVLSSMLYNWLVERFSIKIVAIASVLIFSGFFLFLSYIIYAGIENNALLYFYYLSISLFGVLLTSQFWVIANLVFDLREAKRLFSFIGAGAIAGGIFGGYLTTFLADNFGNAVVALVATVFLLLTLPLILWVWHLRIDRLNKYIKHDRKAGKHQNFLSSYALIFRSKHLINIAAIVGLSVIVAKLVDYQFSDFSHQAYRDSDELASFFGFWFSSFNIVSLLIQLFLTNRLLERFGVSTNLIFLPMALAIGSIIFMLVPELWVLILLKGIDTSFKQSVNKSAFELSILPVSYEIKKQAKPFIDVVVDSIATGLAGILLILVIEKMNLDARSITMITLSFLFVWFILIYRLRNSYFDAFRTNIRKLVSGDDDKIEENTGSLKTSIKTIFKYGRESEIIKLLNHFEPEHTEIYSKQVIGLLDHQSDRVKAAAIHTLYGKKGKKLKTKMIGLIEHSKDDEVVYEAMEYILAQRDTDQEQIFRKYLDHKSDYIKNAALLSLSRAARYNSALAGIYNLDKRISDQIKEFTDYEAEQRKEEIAALLLSIGYFGKEKYYSFIDKYLNGSDPFLVKYAIKAAGLSRYEPFITKLVKLMHLKMYREDIVNALMRYGESIVTRLYQLDQDELIDSEVRGEIPRVIEKFKSKRAIVTVLNLLESKDVLLRKNASESLKKIKDPKQKIKVNKSKLSNLIFNECMYFKDSLTAVYSLSENREEKTKETLLAREVLTGHLQRQIDHSLETIFNLLGLKYAESDMDMALEGVKKNDDESRINAVEFLSNMLDSDLKDELLPLLEYHFLEDREVNLDFKIMNEPELFSLLFKRRGVISKKLILKLLLTYKDLRPFKEAVKPLLNHKNPDIKRLAKQVFDKSSDLTTGL